MLAVRLARHIENRATTDAWDIDAPDYNRVLGIKRSKKQPTTLLTEYIGELRGLRNQNGNVFQHYLSQFAEESFDRAEQELIDSANQGRTLTSPDVILHEEGCLNEINHNLIAVEIKASSSLRYERVIDLARVKAFVTEKEEQGPFPAYQYGLYLFFNNAGFRHGWLFLNQPANENPMPFALP